LAPLLPPGGDLLGRRQPHYRVAVTINRLGLLVVGRRDDQPDPYPDPKVENLAHAVSLHYMHYNFARPHTTLTKAAGGYPTTPAMAAGVTNRVWTHTDIAALFD